MRIGISVFTHAGQNVWENGLGQNVFYLARLLRTLPFVEEVLLLNCADLLRRVVEAGLAH